MLTIELQNDHLPMLGSPAPAQTPDTAPLVRNEPAYVAEYDMSHMAEHTKKDIIAHSDGDERLFAAHLGLQRFLQDYRNGMTSPEQDFDQRLQSHLGQIAMREQDLGLRDVHTDQSI